LTTRLTSTVSCASFLPQRSPYHCDLHSFPTRRSSDLARVRRAAERRPHQDPPHLPGLRAEQGGRRAAGAPVPPRVLRPVTPAGADRKSTRLNSSHVKISYAVFCLKKKKSKNTTDT